MVPGVWLRQVSAPQYPPDGAEQQDETATEGGDGFERHGGSLGLFDWNVS